MCACARLFNILTTCTTAVVGVFDMRSFTSIISSHSKELIDVDSLVYRGEGNNNIVLANDKGIIYRIRKDSIIPDLLNKKTRAYKKSPHQTVLFGQHRMTHFFGAEFLPPSFLIDVDSSFLKKIDTTFRSERPEFRLNRQVDVTSRRILAVADATILPSHLTEYGEGPTLCVEIKPKFGAMLQDMDRDELDRAKQRNSMFCMMQFHETKMRMWGQQSSYCPCDLFSGDRRRMLIALKAMYAVPQNNFRVFLDSIRVRNNKINLLDDALSTFFCNRHNNLSSGFQSGGSISLESDGSSPYPDTSISVESLVDLFPLDTTPALKTTCDLHSFSSNYSLSPNLSDIFLECLILEGLLLDFSNSGRSFVKPKSFRYDCQLHCDEDGVNYGTSTSDLPHNSILGRIFAAQLRSSRSHENIIEHYNRVHAFFQTNDINWNAFVSGIIIPDTTGADPLLIESLELVEDHLVAMAARDCSLMLTFQRAKSDCPDEVNTVGGRCPCLPRTIVNATVVDLDPKRLNNLDERVSMEKVVISNFLKVTSQA